MICAFSGHRPQRLPWGTDESDPRCAALKIKLRRELRRLAEQGADTFLCGMARGCDFYFAEAVLELRGAGLAARLWAALPCADQADGWPEADRARYQRLLEGCDRVVCLQEAYTAGCMLRRNRWMTEHADCLMTVYDGGPGGTAWTVRAAGKRGMPVIALWL